MTTPLANTRILLGISGGIAAYKGPALVRALSAAGAEVRVVLTASATQFVAPLALQAVSHNAVGVDLFDPAYEAQIGHIELARWPDAILIAPATANLIARVRLGLCDDLLTTVLCATTAPVALAPAMNAQMFLNPAVQENLDALRARHGYRVIAPDSGQLACQEVGPGRMPDPPVLIEALAATLAPQLLKGRRVVVTAGPTREAIDPVRFISNRATGKMGFALARVAARMGAHATLVAGPTHLDTPPGVERIDVTSAADMHRAVFAQLDRDTPPDAVVKSAAVADWTPATTADHKVKKTPEVPALPLTRTRDILADLGALDDEARPFLIGFAAETQDLERYALDKLTRKRADMLVANNVLGPSSAFGADSSSVIVYTKTGGREPLGPSPKADLAVRIWTTAAQQAGWVS